MSEITYLIKRHYENDMVGEYTTPSLVNAIDYLYSDDEMCRENGHALSIHKIIDGEELGSVFELNYYGNCEVNIDKCATNIELKLIYDTVRAVTGKI